ncbi:hypothetical protein CAPTEDRAFT_181391 [Capitella teleta]|uniref:Beta-galactosidase n=1 Tax=Capitella teleta TaxID=283909 RepID=R7T9I6_CAPTE|nr:hypothetical protein CAPTEDRAFT_181391 [Capitella teleta]|eukprot:ELT88070.1 hypothetical protein CAPTEDRAFT_181391 [Capitella teleta]
MPVLETRDDAFFLNGKKTLLLSGAVHYFRVVPEYWRDRLLKVKAAGLNCVETYVAWNAHEAVRGTFDFSGILDLRRFIQIAQDVGLYVLLRPGPYICSEWDFGGLPSWLLHDPEMKVRTSYPPYLEAVDAYLAKILPLVNDLQMSKGGPIIAVQLENEYGSYGDDLDYKLFLKNQFIKYGIEELLFTSDNGTGIQNGPIPGVLATTNFQEQEQGYLMFEYLRNIKQPGLPMMVMEFWSGWFDHWGEQHNLCHHAEFIDVFKWILLEGSSVNFYMFHGGTNFGFMAGANEDFGATNEGGGEPYAADTTSYDYDCPVSESGQLNEKFYEIRNILSEMKTLLPPGSGGLVKKHFFSIIKFFASDLKMERCLPLEKLSSLAPCIASKEAVAMEMLDINNHGGQGHGLILYRKQINSADKLHFTEIVHDRAIVLVNGQQVDVFDHRSADHVTTLDLKGNNHVLEIVVENMGRVNYSDFQKNIFNEQRKGLTSPVLLDGQVMQDWEITPLEWKSDFLERVRQSNEWTPCTENAFQNRPVLYESSLVVDGDPRDTFVQLKGWGKGFVIVNGFNIGRYWDLGPQETLYLPGPLLKKGNNEIFIFEYHEANSSRSVSFVAEPFLGEPRLHTTYIPFYGRMFITALKTALWFGPWVWRLLRLFVK